MLITILGTESIDEMEEACHVGRTRRHFYCSDNSFIVISKITVRFRFRAAVMGSFRR